MRSYPFVVCPLAIGGLTMSEFLMNNEIEIIDNIPLPTSTKKQTRKQPRKRSSNLKEISIFQEELEYHLAIPGTPYYIARQRAIDYTRRYTRREVPIDKLLSLEDDVEFSGQHILGAISLEISPDACLLQEGNFVDANLSPESRALFNDLIRKLLTEFVKLGDDFENELFGSSQLNEKIAIAYLARIIRIANLEHILNDDLQQIVHTALGGRTPWTILDLSIVCGYKIRAGSRLDNNFQKELNKVQAGLREYVQDKVIAPDIVGDML